MVWRMREFYNRGISYTIVVSFLCLILLSSIPYLAQAESANLTGVTVAVYNGSGEMDSSRIALERMFEWMGATVVEVNASQVLGDYLDDCDILVFPGGSESSYWSDLEHQTGILKIREFVENGGSYFGICGGSTFGAMYVDLFNGTMSPTNEPGDLIHLEPMFPNRSSTGPDLADCPVNFTTMYYASQYFIPYEGVNVHVVATYESGKAGMIAFEYGYGTVFLSSPHPEYEENDDRDGTSEFDYLDDPDSEWSFLLKISQWLIEASSDPPPNTETATTSGETSTTTTISTGSSLDIQVIAFTTTGVVMVVLLVAVLFRRMHH